MIRVKITRGTHAAEPGQPVRVVGVGELLTLSDADARLLFSLGKAVPALAPLEDAAAPTPQHAAPGDGRPKRTR